MDEPLGALDAEFREAMRAEIKRLHLAQHATTVYVTHDQVEAMAMGDRIVVMSDAVVQQIGTPAEVYHNPANLFVANFIGSPGMNLIKGKYADGVVHLPGGNKLPRARRMAAAPLAQRLDQRRGDHRASAPRRRRSPDGCAARADGLRRRPARRLHVLHVDLDGRRDRPAPAREPRRSSTRSTRRSASTSTRRWCASSIPKTEAAIPLPSERDAMPWRCCNEPR